MGKKLIQLENITKTYDGNMILDDFNLYVKENEFLTLLGPVRLWKDYYPASYRWF